MNTMKDHDKEGKNSLQSGMKQKIGNQKTISDSVIMWTKLEQQRKLRQKKTWKNRYKLIQQQQQKQSRRFKDRKNTHTHTQIVNYDVRIRESLSLTDRFNFVKFIFIYNAQSRSHPLRNCISTRTRTNTHTHACFWTKRDFLAEWIFFRAFVRFSLKISCQFSAWHFVYDYKIS